MFLTADETVEDISSAEPESSTFLTQSAHWRDKIPILASESESGPDSENAGTEFAPNTANGPKIETDKSSYNFRQCSLPTPSTNDDAQHSQHTRTGPYQSDISIKGSNLAPPLEKGRTSRKLRRQRFRRIQQAAQNRSQTAINAPPPVRTACRGHQSYNLHSGQRTGGSRHPLSRHRRNKEARVYVIPDHISEMKNCHRQFEGGATDTGAQLSVIGLRQARAYCAEVGVPFKPLPSSSRFSFGAGKSKYLSKIPLVVSTPQTLTSLHVDFVPQDIPFLIGLDIMDKYSLQVLSVSNELECIREGWRVPLTRKNGLIYWEWFTCMPTFFTRSQLERLHRHLLHPSTRKLYSLLRRANPAQLTFDTMATLKGIQNTCETCQMYAPKQLMFRIRHADKVRFNQEVRLDIVYLDGDQKNTHAKRSVFLVAIEKQRAVLHVVDVSTKFQSAAFLPALDTATIWNTFVKVWSEMYVGSRKRVNRPWFCFYFQRLGVQLRIGSNRPEAYCHREPQLPWGCRDIPRPPPQSFRKTRADHPTVL